MMDYGEAYEYMETWIYDLKKRGEDDFSNCVQALTTGMEALDMVVEALSNERPKGRWKRCKYSHRLGECSLCGEIVEIRSKFCPNCGAEMRGEEE